MRYVSAVRILTEAGNGRNSPERLKALCETLGQINTGSKFIVVYNNQIGVAAGELIASMLTASGFHTALLKRDAVYDLRETVSIDGEMPTHESFASLVLEVSRGTKRLMADTPGYENFTNRELTMATGLLAARIAGCEFVVIVAEKDDPFTACEPTDICVLPVVAEDSSTVRRMSTIIQGKIRETIVRVPSNVEYNIVADACSNVGCRLTQIAVATQSIQSVTPSGMTFSYRDRSGYSLKNSSVAVQTAAMLAIEVLASLKRMGLKFSLTSVVQGMANVKFPMYGEKISALPNIILDCASDIYEMEMVAPSFAKIPNLTVYISDKMQDNVAKLFPEGTKICTIGEDGAFTNPDSAATVFMFNSEKTDTLLCLGSPEFVGSFKLSIRKIIDQM